MLQNVDFQVIKGRVKDFSRDRGSETVDRLSMVPPRLQCVVEKQSDSVPQGLHFTMASCSSTKKDTEQCT